MKNKTRKLSQVQIIGVGFLVVIFVGSLLLLLPFATARGEQTSFLDALFTATSATSVTGLIVKDTFSHWTWFGRTVILIMIQIGGLGFVSIRVFFATILRKKVSLRQRRLMQESVNAVHISGMVKLTRFIIKWSLIIELVGAILLAVRFIPQYGLLTGIYFSIFHSVSAFCNAGFDLMGGTAPFSSFVAYSGDIYVNLILMALILIGGLGFLVWADIGKNRHSFRKMELHTKIVLMMTAILVVVPAVLFWALERNRAFAGMPFSTQIISSLFAAVTPRTAGFNTIDLAAMGENSKLLTIILMFIGGNPGSTAGGIKTTTFLMTLLFIGASFRGQKSCNLFGRRLDDAGIGKALVVFGTNLFLAVAATFIISSIQKLPLVDVMLETFSAIGTVGMSTGITRELTAISRVLIMFLMYCGRVGSLSFAMSLFDKRKEDLVQNPVEEIRIG